MLLHVTLTKSEDGWVVAECPALPGCVSQGKDDREALENIKEAAAGWLWAVDSRATTELSTEPDREVIVIAV